MMENVPFLIVLVLVGLVWGIPMGIQVLGISYAIPAILSVAGFIAGIVLIIVNVKKFKRTWLAIVGWLTTIIGFLSWAFFGFLGIASHY